VVLPALARVRPDAAVLLAAIAADAAEANGALDAVADRVAASVLAPGADGSFVLARDLLLRYPVAVRARVLRTALRRLGSAPGRSGTRAALEFITSGAGGGVIELAGGVRLERSFDRLVLRRAAEPIPADRPVVIAEPDDGRGEALIGGRRFVVHWSRSDPGGDGDAAVFDPTALRFPLELRGWRPGDRIRLDYGSKKLNKLYVERRVARGTRSRIPVLAEGGGRGDRIVWVVGHARAAAARPVETGARFYIRVKDAEHG
jgi:tRNA(Ile)-lysidine synthetase-like protein